MAKVEDFARATGVNEVVYQCMTPGCGHLFRSGAKNSFCPKCKGSRVRDVREGHDQPTDPTAPPQCAHTG